MLKAAKWRRESSSALAKAKAKKINIGGVSKALAARQLLQWRKR